MTELTLRDRLVASGAPEADIAWFDQIGWDPARVPPLREQDVMAYRHRIDLLTGLVDSLTFAERGNSDAGRMAAAIGARVADYEDEQDGDEE